MIFGSSRPFWWLGREYALSAWHEPSTERERASETEARWVVSAAAWDPDGQRALADVLSGASYEIAYEGLEQRALEALEAGWIRVSIVPLAAWELSTLGEDEAPEEATDAPAVEAEVRHWIEIELVDDAGEPVPFEPFELISATGRRRTGQLDGRGFARVEQLEDTQYDVRFPNFTSDNCRRA